MWCGCSTWGARMGELREVASVAVEVIMGLPGDAPENFRRNFERARRLPCALRVYHCVVLPSALMVRSPPEHALDYDSVSLKMRSCLGWPAAALAAEAEFLDREAARSGGQAGEFFWCFPPPRGRGKRLPVSEVSMARADHRRSTAPT